MVWLLITRFFKGLTQLCARSRHCPHEKFGSCIAAQSGDNPAMKPPVFYLFVAASISAASVASASAQTPAPSRPFTTSLSNNTPLVFGMDAETVARVLHAPLTYVQGAPGDETFMVIRNTNGDGFLFRNDPLYLQFRKGRLTGWKGDWSRKWMW